MCGEGISKVRVLKNSFLVRGSSEYEEVEREEFRSIYGCWGI